MEVQYNLLRTYKRPTYNCEKEEKGHRVSASPSGLNFDIFFLLYFQILVLGPLQESDGNGVQQESVGGNFAIDRRDPDLGRPK